MQGWPKGELQNRNYLLSTLRDKLKRFLELDESVYYALLFLLVTTLTISTFNIKFISQSRLAHACKNLNI